jgi:hypothetical protein
MVEQSHFVAPYKPSRIHTIYRWIDRLPGPYWLVPVAILFIAGLLNHIVAWREGVLAQGEINWAFAFTGFFLAYFLFANDFLIRMAKDSLLEFLPALKVSENKCREIMYEFTYFPTKDSTIFFLIGAIVGCGAGMYLLPTAPEMNYAFPELEVPMYTLSMGLVFMTIFLIFRALRLVGQLFEMKVTIDIFDQSSIHAISRYSAWMVIIIAIPTYVQFVLIPSFTEIKATILTITAIPLTMGLIVFWLPLRGVNRLLVLEKRRLLKDINLRIKSNFELLHSRMDDQKYKEIVYVREMMESLQVERKFIKSTRTWPWQTSTLTGLLSAVVLPTLGSLLIECITKFITF